MAEAPQCVGLRLATAAREKNETAWNRVVKENPHTVATKLFGVICFQSTSNIVHSACDNIAVLLSITELLWTSQ